MPQQQIEEKVTQPLRPLLLVDVVLAYALGLGIADYLGVVLMLPAAILGAVWALALQMGASYLFAYFQSQESRTSVNRRNQEFVEQIPLWIGLTALAIAASVSIPLMTTAGISASAWIIMVLLLVGAFASAVPPLQLADGLYRELILSVGLATLIPALAFSLQGEELHRLVSMTTFPLTLLHFSVLLTYRFPRFSQDLKEENSSLLVRLGWEQGMRLINLFILLAFFFLGLAMLMGLPSKIAMPAFLALPLGLLQIWYFHRIAGGVKPRWKVLRWLSLSVFGLTSYLLTFTFWIR